MSDETTSDLTALLAEHRDCSMYDEGIWADGEVALLRCSCGWTKNIPIDDDVRPVFPIWERHLAEQITAAGFGPVRAVEAEREEVDRNARAYGWEIGRGHPLVEQIESTSEDNPFLSPDWRGGTVSTERLVTENDQEFLMRTLTSHQWKVVAKCLRAEAGELTARAESAEAALAGHREGFSAAEVEMLGLRDGSCECCWIVDAIGLDEFIAKRVAEAFRPAAMSDTADVCVLWLCETEQVALRPDLLYRFEVKDGCERCASLAAPYRPRVKPTADTLLADLAATTAADAKAIWRRALNGGAS